MRSIAQSIMANSEKDLDSIYTSTKDKYQTDLKEAANIPGVNLTFEFEETVKTVLPDQPNTHTLDIVYFSVDGPNTKNFWRNVAEKRRIKVKLPARSN